MKRNTITFLFALSFMQAACTNVEDSLGSGAGATAGSASSYDGADETGPDSCESDSCNLGSCCVGGERCCSGTDLMLCVEDVYQFAENNEYYCPNDELAVQCVEGAQEPIEIPCEDSEVCDPDEGCIEEYLSCTDDCVEGTIRCTGPLIEVCQRGEANDYCTAWAIGEDCGLANMTCQVYEGVHRCVNECNGLTPLEHMSCEMVEDLSCAWYYCDLGSGILLPDHVACLPGGADCEIDGECSSCLCVDTGDGLKCIGDGPSMCAPAEGQC